MNELFKTVCVLQALRIEQAFESRSVHFGSRALLVGSRLEAAVPLECDERSEDGP